MDKILYAEDDPQVADLVRLYLSHAAPDYSLEVVTKGHECLERMSQGRYDLLLLDVMLPDINGLEVLSKLVLRNDSTPVVVISNYGQNDLAVRALRAGAVDCIDKNTSQFSQLAEIARVAIARGRRPEAGARDRANGSQAILLLKPDSATGEHVAEAFAADAPHFRLIAADTRAEFERHLNKGGRVDAVVIGSNAVVANPLDLVRLARFRAPDAPIVVLSPGSDGEVVAAAFKLGASDFILQKPGYLRELVLSLNHCLR